jgi:hypothetical protein
MVAQVFWHLETADQGWLQPGYDVFLGWGNLQYGLHSGVAAAEMIDQ